MTVAAQGRSATNGVDRHPPLAGVGDCNYSDAGVGEKCLDCAEEKRVV